MSFMDQKDLERFDKKYLWLVTVILVVLMIAVRAWFSYSLASEDEESEYCENLNNAVINESNE